MTYLGTASLLIELAGLRFLTDPALDPRGTAYDFGPWYAPRAWFASEKQYATPPLDAGDLDAVLLTHDHHADNLDLEGRQLIASSRVRQVLTTTAAARRLAAPAPRRGPTQPGEGLGIGAKVTGLAWGASTRVGEVTITATPARHGPLGTPRIHEVCGFIVEAPGAPVVWISGDTVLFPELRRALQGQRIDIAVVHAGGVRFPRVPVIGNALFTFDAAQVTEVLAQVQPRIVVPIHREGWPHFRQPAAELRAALDAASWGSRTRWLELGQSVEL